jgi:hypothetical protein
MIIRRKEGDDSVPYFSTRSEAKRAADEVREAVKDRLPWTQWGRLMGTDGVVRWGVVVEERSGLFAVSVIMSGQDCGIAERSVPCDGGADEVVESCLRSRKADQDAGFGWEVE